MTTTTISSATREVHIGFDQPFVIIGERINPTGRKILAEEMKNGDYSRVEADALGGHASGWIGTCNSFNQMAGGQVAGCDCEFFRITSFEERSCQINTIVAFLFSWSVAGNAVLYKDGLQVSVVVAGSVGWLRT